VDTFNKIDDGLEDGRDRQDGLVAPELCERTIIQHKV
jgi:hypothetical protein